MALGNRYRLWGMALHGGRSLAKTVHLNESHRRAIPRRNISSVLQFFPAGRCRGTPYLPVLSTVRNSFPTVIV